MKKVLYALRRSLSRDSIFYDQYYEADLARFNLDTKLQAIYGEESELIIVFLSASYDRKTWCGLEWRVMRDIIKQQEEERVMLVRLDGTNVPGVLSIDGSVFAIDRDPEEVADLILERLELNRRRKTRKP